MDKLELLSDTAIKLLSYHQSGNATSLRAILDQSFAFAKPTGLDERFWRANLRLALELSGHLEVIETPSTQRWTFGGLISRVPRQNFALEYSSRQNLLQAHPARTSEIRSGLTTNDGFTIWQVATEDKELPLKGKIYDHLPSKGKIEESVCDFVRGGPDFSLGIWERFDFRQFKWVIKTADSEQTIGLFKNSDHRTGRSVWVADEKGNSWKFIFPEWAMLFAAPRLGLRIDSAFNYSQGTLAVHRAFRIPRILLKELVLSSDSIHVDWNINFHGVRQEDYSSLERFLQKRGFAA